MNFDNDVGALGFELVQQRRDGSRQYSMRGNPYLAYWLLVSPNGTVELSWEFALGEYLRAKGFSVSAQDELSLLVFPSEEVRGPVDATWVQSEVQKVQERLSSVDLVYGT